MPSETTAATETRGGERAVIRIAPRDLQVAGGRHSPMDEQMQAQNRSKLAEDDNLVEWGSDLDEEWMEQGEEREGRCSHVEQEDERSRDEDEGGDDIQEHRDEDDEPTGCEGEEEVEDSEIQYGEEDAQMDETNANSPRSSEAFKSEEQDDQECPVTPVRNSQHSAPAAEEQREDIAPRCLVEGEAPNVVVASKTSGAIGASSKASVQPHSSHADISPTQAKSAATNGPRLSIRNPAAVTTLATSPRRGQSTCSLAETSPWKPLHRAGSLQIGSSSQFWVPDPARRSSRLLDEWKRKEIWHDFKRAEGHILLGPQQPLRRQDELLQSLREELVPSSRSGLHVRRETISSAYTEPPRQETLESQRKRMWAMSHQGGEEPDMGSVTSSTAKQTVEVAKEEQFEAAEERARLRAELREREAQANEAKESMRVLKEKLVSCETVERDMRSLKDDNQRLLMQEMSMKEMLETLEAKLALLTKSEAQLKLQTHQLLQQNQALQADLLEKIGSETAKIQKMAHLSHENQNLQEELQRKVSQGVVGKQQALREVIVRHLLLSKYTKLTRLAFSRWHRDSVQELTTERLRHAAMRALYARLRLQEHQAVSHAFARIAAHAEVQRHRMEKAQVESKLDDAAHRTITICFSAGIFRLARVFRRRDELRVSQALAAWNSRTHQQQHVDDRVSIAIAKLGGVQLARSRSCKARAVERWKAILRLRQCELASEGAKDKERGLAEAKECIFSLSCAKARLEEKLKTAQEEVGHLGDQVHEGKAELQLVKHGYVASVVRSVERAWLRDVFAEWRLQAATLVACRELQLQADEAEVRANDRDQYAKSLDDYNKVLRADLERLQFFSQDKRVTVDALTKTLMREQEQRKQMEELHVGLEEKLGQQQRQLTVVMEWQGVLLPTSLIAFCKDVLVARLHHAFLRLACNASATSNVDISSSANQPTSAADFATLNSESGPRLAVTSMVDMMMRLLPRDVFGSMDEVASLVRRHVPDYACSCGVRFPEFIGCLNGIIDDLGEWKDKQANFVKLLWTGLVACAPSSSTFEEHEADTLEPNRSAWAGQLSEDILQNQERLLAVLEHETAVVERAVLEESALKHAYSASEPSCSSSTAFHEYQCDPVGTPCSTSAPSHSSSLTTAISSSAAEATFSPAVLESLHIAPTWSSSPPVQDLFLAFRRPLARILAKYALNDQRGLELSGVFRMLGDMNLFPSFLSRDAVRLQYGHLCDPDGVLSSSALSVFLGACALELYAQSPTEARGALPLSAREIILSFFCDLGLLADSELPLPPRVCLVGVDAENVLWPLFEYYAGNQVASSFGRVGLTESQFCRFVGDMIGDGGNASSTFRLAMKETQRPGVDSDASGVSTMLHLDEFYVSIALLFQEQHKSPKVVSLGDGVRQWMQQIH